MKMRNELRPSNTLYAASLVFIFISAASWHRYLINTQKIKMNANSNEDRQVDRKIPTVATGQKILIKYDKNYKRVVSFANLRSAWKLEL